LEYFRCFTDVCGVRLRPHAGSGRIGNADTTGDASERDRSGCTPISGRDWEKRGIRIGYRHSGGRITERHFQDGENLKKGQILFVIDPCPYRAQFDSALATLAQAKAALDLAEIQFARDEEVIGTRAISKQDYDTKKNTVDVDQAQVDAAEAALETARLNLEYCYIHSSIDGRGPGELSSWRGNHVQRCDKCPRMNKGFGPEFANMRFSAAV
jgi:hypothetical protein